MAWLFCLASSRCTLLCSVPNALLCRTCSVFLSLPPALFLLLCSSSSVSVLTAPPAAPANHLRHSISLACFASCAAHLHSVHAARPFSRGSRRNPGKCARAASLVRLAAADERLSPRRDVRFEHLFRGYCDGAEQVSRSVRKTFLSEIRNCTNVQRKMTLHVLLYLTLLLFHF